MTQEQPRDAIIIAGGFGTRMKHLTQETPKPMVELAGKPIVQYQVEQMRNAGVEHIVFATGYLPHKITEHFGDGSDFGLQISYSHEDTPLGRGGAIKQAMQKLPKDWEHVVVTNADNLWDTDLQAVYEKHVARQATATIVVVPRANQFGVVEINDNDEIVAFREKPVFDVNAGIYVFSRGIYDQLPDVGDHEKSTFPELPQDKKVAYRHTGTWKNIDTPYDLEEAHTIAGEVFPNRKQESTDNPNNAHYSAI